MTGLHSIRLMSAVLVRVPGITVRSGQGEGR